MLIPSFGLIYSVTGLALYWAVFYSNYKRASILRNSGPITI
jgi:hypothetical protein